MGGCFIGLFVKKKMLERIKEFYFCKVKAGMGGLASNKGSVALRFNIDDTSFAILNCHLKSGKAVAVQRTQMLKTILDQAFIKAKGLYKTQDHDIVYVFGDLNFRVDLKNK